MIAVNLSGQSLFEERTSRKGRCAVCFEVHRLVRRGQLGFGDVYFRGPKVLMLPKHIACICPDTVFYMDLNMPFDMRSKFGGLSWVMSGADHIAASLTKKKCES